MKRIVHRIMTPLRYFINDSRTVGIILIICTLLSIFLANKGIGLSYRNFWNSEMHSFKALHLPATYLEWINNFLMGIFFLMAGTEIKRELMEGELSSFKKAILPFGAALGGMMVPALIFIAFNVHSSYITGWGIPTATDIAFSLGIASLLGKRVPLSLKILLMALAIIDDLGAIIVIALFYGGQLHWTFLAIAGAIFLALMACNYFKIKFGFLQIILAVCLWYAILQSGIEASIAGVIFAFTIPTKKLVAVEKFIHNFVNFFILPLFALANTALFIPAHFAEALGSTVGIGIIVGLVVGKPLGIFLISRLLVSLNIAKLPHNIQWKQILGMGTLAGIGFTMSIFTTMLAFGDDAVRDIAKIAILTSVALSVVASVLYFWAISTETDQSVAHLHKPVVTPPSLDLQLELN
ncbi:Na+/H+ antiporter NhaA [Ferruginibacter paludis]|uniref:Na+/H+ antiporter NhaA n=1 Tax=Ferruginibacter paludis TaxID=1310417 RepID=UPI0025B578F3|nr:Na+/H+ antiporter NhaA [Ferruginibacter paludis]MDN3654796.1 Na+/H+ antiporter NhaA [Ferruginibacter paludis]